MFDKDKSGAIDLDELAEAMKSTGIEATESELKKMMANVSDRG
jgi:Ca2+-binding EF-hand superfamily protein